MMPFDDAVPVPSATSGHSSSASQENKASERSQDASLPKKSIDRSGHDSVPSATAHGVTAPSTTAIVTVATTNAVIVGESRGSSYNSSSCSSSTPLDPYKGSSITAAPTSTSKNQRQQQQPGEASVKGSTFHSLEGVENGHVGAGQRSLAMIESDEDGDGDRFLSESSGSMAGESEAASRFGVVGIGGAKESHEVGASCPQAFL